MLVVLVVDLRREIARSSGTSVMHDKLDTMLSLVCVCIIIGSVYFIHT
jgi:hypothetical protein